MMSDNESKNRTCTVVSAPDVTGPGFLCGDSGNIFVTVYIYTYKFKMSVKISMVYYWFKLKLLTYC